MSKPETIRTTILGKVELRLVRKDGAWFGLADGKILTEGDDADRVWMRLHDEVGKHGPRYVGFNGARARFRRFFPGGFASAGYAKEERDYKLAAKALLDSIAPLAAAATGEGFGEAVLKAFHATNLLHPTFEKARVREVLLGPDADRFVRGAARFAQGEIGPGLAEMEKALKPRDAAKWTAVTYLPFLWRPEAHMFLKPQVTTDFAERVGHPFAHVYQAALKPEVYASLLDLAARTETEISELAPADRIDVQSFIWVVGDYEEGREESRP